MHINVYFLSAMASILVLAWEGLRTVKRSQSHNIEDIVTKAIASAIDPVMALISRNDNRLVVLETKMDLVIGGMAHNAAAVLHHPDSTRKRIDYLLDVFRAGTITEMETQELRDHLEFILHWEDGQAAPYRIFQGEQAAAGLMLATMDHVVTPEVTDGLSDPDADSTEEAGTRLSE